MGACDRTAAVKGIERNRPMELAHSPTGLPYDWVEYSGHSLAVTKWAYHLNCI